MAHATKCVTVRMDEKMSNRKNGRRKDTKLYFSAEYTHLSVNVYIIPINTGEYFISCYF